VTSVICDAVISLVHQLKKSSNQQQSVLLSMSGQLDGYLKEVKLHINKLVLYGTEGLFGCRTFQQLAHLQGPKYTLSSGRWHLAWTGLLKHILNFQSLKFTLIKLNISVPVSQKTPRLHQYICMVKSCKTGSIYRVSQEECARLRKSVPYVKLYRYNPKHLYPKLNVYGDNGQRSLKLWQLLLIDYQIHIETGRNMWFL